jgi:hypothetical protein
MKNEPTILSAELLEKYALGQLQPAEMQRIENLMLENPFLAETVEGIVFAKNSFAKDVSTLKEQMPYRQQKENAKLFVTKNNTKKVDKNKLALAAVILLLVSSTAALWFLFQNSKHTTENTAYKVETTQNTNTEAKVITPEKQAEKITQKPNAETKIKQATESPIQDMQKDMVLPITHAAEVTTADRGELPKTDKNIADTETINSSESKKEMPSATIISKTAGKTANKDQQESKEEGKKEEVLLADDLDATKTTVAESSKNSRVQIAEKEKAKKENSRNKVISDSAISFENYKEYVEKNLNKSVAKGKSGEVIAQVSINKNGKMIAIEILKPLCEACDKEVTRILAEIAKQTENKTNKRTEKVKKAKKIKISINF